MQRTSPHVKEVAGHFVHWNSSAYSTKLTNINHSYISYMGKSRKM